LDAAAMLAKDEARLVIARRIQYSPNFTALVPLIRVFAIHIEVFAGLHLLQYLLSGAFASLINVNNTNSGFNLLI
jgi:hypothetical protein